MAVEVRRGEERAVLVLHEGLLLGLVPHPEDDDVVVALPRLGVHRVRPGGPEEDEALAAHLVDRVAARPRQPGDMRQRRCELMDVLDARPPRRLSHARGPRRRPWGRGPAAAAPEPGPEPAAPAAAGTPRRRVPAADRPGRARQPPGWAARPATAIRRAGRSPGRAPGPGSGRARPRRRPAHRRWTRPRPAR